MPILREYRTLVDGNPLGLKHKKKPDCQNISDDISATRLSAGDPIGFPPHLRRWFSIIVILDSYLISADETGLTSLHREFTVKIQLRLRFNSLLSIVELWLLSLPESLPVFNKYYYEMQAIIYCRLIQSFDVLK